MIFRYLSSLSALFMASFWLLVMPAVAAGPDFTLHKLGEGEAPAVLVVGGIQGDEPGGFSAATLLITSYRITKGSVWVVPNLNFPSIIERSRGLHGDMNRKFATLAASDPEYAVVRRIQELIRTPGLALVLNMHDGGGFYRPKKESQDRNPARWGQCLIVDVAEMPHPAGQLAQRGEQALEIVNQNLLKPEHKFYLKNTRTDLGNSEMEKTLSWYAVRNGTPAFGLEASKNFPVEVRAYYHLLMLEPLLRQAGVEFERAFDLSPRGVSAALQDDVHVAFNENRVLLPLDNARPRLVGRIPMPKDAVRTLFVSKPILAVIRERDEMTVHYGNRVLTRFKPDWREADLSLSELSVEVDGEQRNIRFGDVVTVKNSFSVPPVKGYRVNAIGANFGRDESGRKLALRDFEKLYSLDKDCRTYRVETYKGERFTGMFLVRFGNARGKRHDALPAVAGKESGLGL